MDKGKDTEALFNVSFETDNISSLELLLQHNNDSKPSLGERGMS